MNKRNRYKRGKLIGRIILLLFASVLVLVFFKASHIIGKMSFVNNGLEYYQEEKWIEAEGDLQRAKDYKWFHYKEAEASSALSALSWITNYKEDIANLYEQITSSSENKDLDTFASYADLYESSGFQSLTEAQKQYLLSKYPIEEALATGWTGFKGSLVSELENPLQGHYNWAKEKIFLVPAQYFSSDKEAAILKLFEVGDQKLYDQYAIATGIQSFRDLIDKLSDIYKTNRNYDLDTSWLTPQVKDFMYKTLLEKSKEDISSFTHYISAYRSGADSTYKDEAIEKIVDEFIVEKEKKIIALLGAKQYDELITLYQDMKYFKDYTKEIEVAEKMQKYEHPEMLLQQPIEQYTFLQTGKNGFNVSQYLIAINKSTSQLELLLFVGSAEEYEVNTCKMSLSDLGITLEQVQKIDVSDDLVGLSLSGSTKASRLQVLRFREDRLELAEDLEGDQIELVDGLKHLRITNPNSETIPYTYDYLLGEEGYEKQEIAAIPVRLSDTNLMDYEGKVITFNCYIPTDENGSSTSAYYYADGTYYSDAMAYIYREDGIVIDKGTYKITGELVSMEPYYNTSLQLEVLRPKIRILEMQKD